jgi:hypothetical protein
MRRMADNGWYGEVHGDRVAVSLPGSEGSDGPAFDMSAAEAKELAAALTEAAEAIETQS